MSWQVILIEALVFATLFANMPRFRLEGTEHMDAAYHQKWFHLKGMLFPGLWWGCSSSSCRRTEALDA